MFMGGILLYMALRLLLGLRATIDTGKSKAEAIETSFKERSVRMRKALAAGETGTPAITMNSVACRFVKPA